jgi:curved DNA-binding protein CbpA
MDLYDILGVPKDASPEEIKSTFRSKAKSTHPDHGGDAAQFTAIAKAYEVLGDPLKRAHYDETGQAPGSQDTERTEALGIVDIIFAEVMNQLQDYNGLVCNDLVADMRKVIVSKMAELDGQIAQTRDRIGRLHKFISRFTVSDGENTLAKMIEYRCTGYEKRMIGLQRGKRLHEVALDIIKDQGFIVDANPQAMMQQMPMQGAVRGGLGSIFAR